MTWLKNCLHVLIDKWLRYYCGLIRRNMRCQQSFTVARALYNGTVYMELVTLPSAFNMCTCIKFYFKDTRYRMCYKGHFKVYEATMTVNGQESI